MVGFAFNYVDMHAEEDGCDLYFHEDENMQPKVPFRALIPQGSSRITVAGRILSAERFALAGIRAQCTCMAKRIIDATGDADLAARAGAPFKKAAVSDLMGVTVSFSCSRVNKKRFMQHINSSPGSYRQWASDTDGKENDMFSPYLEVPFKKAKLRSFCASLGTRESRKIIGRENLTDSQIRNQARFEDSIGIFPEFLDGYNTVILPTTGCYFQIPYGIILPQKVENLLVAGRSVAGDQGSHSATRQMMCCAVTGQGQVWLLQFLFKTGCSVRWWIFDRFKKH